MLKFSREKEGEGVVVVLGPLIDSDYWEYCININLEYTFWVNKRGGGGGGVRVILVYGEKDA